MRFIGIGWSILVEVVSEPTGAGHRHHEHDQQGRASPHRYHRSSHAIHPSRWRTTPNRRRPASLWYDPASGRWTAMTHSRFVCSLLVAMLVVAGLVVASGAPAQAASATFSAPVYAGDFPDATVVLVNGTYWAYSTGSG